MGWVGLRRLAEEGRERRKSEADVPTLAELGRDRRPSPSAPLVGALALERSSSRSFRAASCRSTNSRVAATLAWYPRSSACRAASTSADGEGQRGGCAAAWRSSEAEADEGRTAARQAATQAAWPAPSVASDAACAAAAPAESVRWIEASRRLAPGALTSGAAGCIPSSSFWELGAEVRPGTGFCRDDADLAAACHTFLAVGSTRPSPAGV